MIKFNELGIDVENNSLVIDVSVKDNSYYENVYLESISIDTQDTYVDDGPSTKHISAYYKESYTPSLIREGLQNVTYKVNFSISEINNYILHLHSDYAYVENVKIVDSTDTFYNVCNIPEQGIGEFVVLNFDNESQEVYFEKSSSNINDLRQKHIRIELSEKDLKTSPINNMFFIYVKTMGTPGIEAPSTNTTRLAITLNTSAIYNNMMQNIKEISPCGNIPKNFIDEYLEYEALRLSINTGHNMEAISIFNKFFKNILTSNTYNCYE